MGAGAGHARWNREAWDRLSADYLGPGRRAWATDEPTWGVWGIRERDLRALPDVAGKDVIELGCGTAYWSAWLARRGARVVGLDNSARQLAHARALQREHGLAFPLVHADAEHAPLSGERFDLVLSEYGAYNATRIICEDLGLPPWRTPPDPWPVWAALPRKDR